jgi:hypothetical protein
MLAAMRVAIHTLEDKNDKQALRAVMINIKEAQYAAYLSKKTADEAKLIAQLEHTNFTYTQSIAPITKPNETTQNDN